MELVRLMSIAADLSQVSLEDAWTEIRGTMPCHLIVGVKEAGTARVLRLNGKSIPIFVNPEWTTEWMLSSPFAKVFSEGA